MFLIFFSSHIKLVIAATSLLFLLSCQTVPLNQPRVICNQDFPSNWQVNGYIKIIAAKKASINIHWQQQGDQFDILLLSPFGQQLAKIIGSIAQANVQLLDQPAVMTTNIQQTLYNYTKWQFPVSQMMSWLLAKSVATPFHAKYNQQGCFSELHQDTYKIFYLDYIKSGYFYLPQKMMVIKEDITLHFYLTSWQLNNGKQ